MELPFFAVSMETRVAMMGAAFFCYLAVMTVFDFASTSVTEKKEAPSFDDAETHHHMKTSAFSAPTVKVLYCIS